VHDRDALELVEGSDLDETLPRWAGQENLEERVAGADRVDPVVLEALRSK